MRIAVIGHHVAPILAPFCGGVETMTSNLAQCLARRGHEVDVFAAPGSEIPGVRMHELVLRAPVGELARRDVSMPPRRFMDAHYAYQRLMLSLAQQPDRYDVVHSQSLHYLPVAMARLLVPPVVLTLHCPPTPWLEAAFEPGVPRTVRAVIPVAVSEATRREWQPRVDVPYVVPNGVDLDRWSPGPGGPDCAWSGRIVPEKAPHLAIAAARRAGRAIRLAGPIIDERYFAHRVEPLLGPDAEYVGHLREDELHSLVSRSAVLVVSPDWNEPFGLVAAEAIASGTPVAAFDRGGLRRVLGKDGGMLAPPDDVDGLADAVRRAAEMPRDRVRRHAEETVDIETAGYAYEQIFERLIDAADDEPFVTDWPDPEEPPLAASHA